MHTIITERLVFKANKQYINNINKNKALFDQQQKTKMTSLSLRTGEAFFF